MKASILLSCALLVLLSAPLDAARAQQVIFQDGFEGGAFDPNRWTARPSLEGAVGGRVDVVNSTDNAHTGSFSAWIGRATDGASTTNALDLRLDLSGRSQVELRFWMRDHFDEPQVQEGLYFSDDGGGTFTPVPVYPFALDDNENVYLYTLPIDVDALASAAGLTLSSTFVIRFQQIGSSDFSQSGDEDGFILDDVSVVGDVNTPTEEGSPPALFTLGQNQPNPFGSATTIPFTLAHSGEVRLAVYDVLGREVAVLVDGPRGAGAHEVAFETANLPSGVYLYRLEAEGTRLAQQMRLVK